MDYNSKKYNKVLEIIDRRLIPDEVAKKARGEVFTPLQLVREMILGIRKSSINTGKIEIWGIKDDTFINDDELDRIGGVPLEILRDSKSTFLDPSNGIGNFPVVLFYILDYQLNKHGKNKEFRGEENTKKRQTHIVTNMLYMIELNKGNVNTSIKIFKLIVPNAKPNICCANTLEIPDEKLMSYFNINRFYVIMGNPPFQAFQEADGKRGGGDELYMKFVKKSIELLKSDGFLIFVHPPSWRKPEFSEGRKISKNYGMFKLMAHDNQLIYLEMHDSKDGMRVFNAGTRYDFYVMKKTNATTKTKIKDVHGNISEVDLRDFEFLPNFNINNVLKLFPKKTKDICELGKFNNNTNKYDNNPCILYERSAYGSDKLWVSQRQSSEYKYPLVHATLQNGPTFYYSSTNKKGMFGISKVIFGDGGINEPFVDIEGKYGMTQHAIGLVIKDNKDAENLKTFLESNFFKNILSACMWSTFGIDWRLFTYFKRNFWKTNINLNESIINSDRTKGGDTRNIFTRKVRSKKNKTRKLK